MIFYRYEDAAKKEWREDGFLVMGLTSKTPNNQHQHLES